MDGWMDGWKRNTFHIQNGVRGTEKQQFTQNFSTLYSSLQPALFQHPYACLMASPCFLVGAPPPAANHVEWKANVKEPRPGEAFVIVERKRNGTGWAIDGNSAFWGEGGGKRRRFLESEEMLCLMCFAGRHNINLNGAKRICISDFEATFSIW